MDLSQVKIEAQKYDQMAAERQQLTASLIGGLQNAQERIEQLDSDLEKQAASEKHWYKEMRSLKEQIDEQRRLEDKFKFVVLLIDGDNYLFKKEHLSAGDQGGRRAATLLRDGIAKQCNVPADSKIIVRLFINWEGLIGFLLKKAWISHRQMFAEFVAGFRRAAEYMDIIDTGSNKDAADIKLLEFYHIHKFQRQCQRLILGCCNDAGYANTLIHDQSEPFIAGRLTLLQAQPPHEVYDSITAERVRLADVFEEQSLSMVSARGRHFSISDSTSVDTEGVALPDRSISDSIRTRGTYAAAMSSTAFAEPATETNKATDESRPKIAVNSEGQRVDEPLQRFSNAPWKERKEQGKGPLCAEHHLGDGCNSEKCRKDHDPVEIDVLLGLKKLMRTSLHCGNTNSCRRLKCFGGHQCPFEGRCTSGESCKFADLHGKDLEVARRVDAAG